MTLLIKPLIPINSPKNQKAFESKTQLTMMIQSPTFEFNKVKKGFFLKDSSKMLTSLLTKTS
jgi:hypothetical protein